MPKPFATREEEWRAYLTGTHPRVRSGRRVFGLLPSGPRCRQCNAPFHGPGGFLLRHLGPAFKPWDKNPNLCRRCLGHLIRQDGSGAEVEISFLFADVRRSSKLARRLGTMDFTRLMQRFYTTANQIFIDHDALLDLVIGDEAVGFFLPFMAGPDHPRKAFETAEDLLRAAGYCSAQGPWIPLGQACTRGRRSSASCHVVRRTSSPRWGMPRDIAAHLAAQAGPGEILVTEHVAAALGAEGLKRRHLSLKGHPVDAFVISLVESGDGDPG